MSTALTERSGPGRPPTFPNPKLEEVFLNLLREGNSVSFACKTLHLSRPTVYAWKRDNEEFAQAWDDAMEASIDGLEDLARQRAKEGSDTMIIFLLKSRRRKIYGERVQNRISGPEGGPIQIENAKAIREEFYCRISGIAARMGEECSPRLTDGRGD